MYEPEGRQQDNALDALQDLVSLTAPVRRISGLLDPAVLVRRAAHEAHHLIGNDLSAIARLNLAGGRWITPLV